MQATISRARTTSRDLIEVPPLSDEKYVKGFTRPYALTKHDRAPKPKPLVKASNDNAPGKHDWPVRDDCLSNKMMTGRSPAETTVLNGQAFAILHEIRELLALTVGDKHNVIGVEDGGERYGSGYGVERNWDMGPSEQRLKELFEFGAKASNDNEPWTPGPCELLDKTALGRTVKALHQVGNLRFDENGKLMHYFSGQNWRPYTDNIRSSKGERTQRPVAADPADLGMYKGAGIPRGKRGEAAVTFLAGRPGPSGSVSNSHGMEDKASHRPPLSAFDPVNGEIANSNAHDAATDRLEEYRGLVGRRLYEALVDAATGLRLDEIGGKRGDKRASAVGRNMVQLAIEHIIESRAPKPRPRNV